MDASVTNTVVEILPHFDGFVYPNESGEQPLWGVLIVLYPYITGLVAGAFIMASLVRVFRVKALEPVYRLSLLTALAFLLCAPLPLLFHLGRPERCYEIMMTPHFSSPMAMFGFVYAWYLMAVLLLELWFDYRKDLVLWGNTVPGYRGLMYRLFTVGVQDVSEPALRLDHKIGHVLSVVGIPSAFLLHGYVGFIFGSVKANPWWGNVLMPIIFVLSAVVSGIALCVFNYQVLCWVRRKVVDMRCIDVMGMFLFYALVVDASIEALDIIHRTFEAEESFAVLQYMATEKLFYTMRVGQVLLGTLVPILLLGALQLFRKRFSELNRRRMYFASALLILIGVLAMRWNVVIGGQLFSKSLRGFMSYKMEFAGLEGWFMGAVLMTLPFVVLTVMIKLFLPEEAPPGAGASPAATAKATPQAAPAR